MYEYKCSSSILAGEATREIPEGDIVPVLEQLQDSLVKSHAESQEKLRFALLDPRLQDDDGVVDAYRTLVATLDSLNTSTEKLRWNILESNADREKLHEPRVMSRPEDIDSFLDSL